MNDKLMYIPIHIMENKRNKYDQGWSVGTRGIITYIGNNVF